MLMTRVLEKLELLSRSKGKQMELPLNGKRPGRDVSTVRPLPTYILQQMREEHKNVLGNEQWKEICPQPSPKRQSSAFN